MIDQKVIVGSRVAAEFMNHLFLMKLGGLKTSTKNMVPLAQMIVMQRLSRKRAYKGIRLVF